MSLKVGPFRTDDERELRRQLDQLERKIDQLERQLAPHGETFSLQFNDGPKPGGAAHLRVSGGDLLLLPSTRPTTPTEGAKLSAVTRAGRAWPAFLDTGGANRELELLLAGSDFISILGNIGVATFTSLGCTPTNVGTLTARIPTTLNALTRRRRASLVSAAGAGSLCSQRVSSRGATTGTGAGVGGFFYRSLFAASDAAAVAGARMFVGVSNGSGAATNVEPSTLVNSIGLAQLSTSSTQTYLCYGGSVAQAPIALGANFAPHLGAVAAGTGSLFQLELWAPANLAGVVHYRVCNLSNGAETSGTLSGDATVIPASTTMLTTQTWRTNNATALAVGLDICETWLRSA